MHTDELFKALGNRKMAKIQAQHERERQGEADKAARIEQGRQDDASKLGELFRMASRRFNERKTLMT